MRTATARRTPVRPRPPADDALTRYLHDIARYPLLTQAEESALAQRIRDGDRGAIDALVCANLRFVVSVAKKYQKFNASLADLISEGNLGLLRAARRFDGDKGVKFITYAVWWIRQSILQSLAQQGHVVRVPLGQISVRTRVGRWANTLRHELGREPTRREVASAMEVPEDVVESAQPIGQVDVSLDAPIGIDDDSSLLDFLQGDEGPASGGDGVDSAMAESLGAALSRLKPREASVVRRYFGIGGSEPQTLEAIGASLGITRERARQIKEKALSRMRKSGFTRALAAWEDRL